MCEVEIEEGEVYDEGDPWKYDDMDESDNEQSDDSCLNGEDPDAEPGQELAGGGGMALGSSPKHKRCEICETS